MLKQWTHRYGRFVLTGLLLLVLVFSASIITTPADVGNHNSYDSGGSSSGSYGGSYSSGDDDGTLFWILFYIFTHLDGPGGIILAVLLIGGFLFYRKNRGMIHRGLDEGRRHMQQSYGQPAQNTVSFDRTAEISARLREKDPAFSADKFITWAKEVFVHLQMAWTKRDWRLARPFESDSLFKTHQQQLQEHIDRHRTNIIENICVNQAYLSHYTSDAEYEYLTVYMDVKMNDYFIDDDSGQVIRGNPREVYRMRYRLKFMRSAGVTTNPSTSNMSTTNCPNCGAPTDITSSGQCKYCDSVITTGKYDWVLCEIVSL